jgi:hypothetical protein
MKYIAFSLLLFVALNLNAQTEIKKSEPYSIEVWQDKMEDKSYATGSKVLMCSDDGKKGFFIRIMWENKGNGKISYNGLSVKSAKIGNCVEKSTLIFLFEDETKFLLTAFNDFNCEGDSYFDWKKEAFKELSSKKIVAIRFTNGRTFDSFTYNVPEKDQSYFIEAREAIELNRITNKK